MSNRPHGLEIRTCLSLIFLSLLFAACGQAPPSTTTEQNLQATVSVLQTQIANRPQPAQTQAQPAQTQAASVPTQVPEAPKSTTAPDSTPANNEQGYVGGTTDESGSSAYFLHWTENNGQITGELLRAGFDIVDGAKEFRTRSMPVTGTRDGQTLNLVIKNIGESQATGIFREDGALELHDSQGQVIHPIFFPATKQRFDELAEQIVNATPKVVVAKIDATKGDPGWQNLSVSLAIRNEGSSPFTIKFANESPSLSIQEGRNYEFRLQLQSDSGFVDTSIGPVRRFTPAVTGPTKEDKEYAELESFPLLPGFAFCGIAIQQSEEGEAAFLRANGRVPEGTTPARLALGNYVGIDLTTPPSPDNCRASNIDKIPQMSTDITLGRQDRPFALVRVKNIDGNAIDKLYNRKVVNVAVDIQNLNKLDELKVTDMRIAIIDEDGIVRPTEPDNELKCLATRYLKNETIGPSQTTTYNFCFPSRPSAKIAAFVVWWLGQYGVVRP
jgi:hypothetical protein